VIYRRAYRALLYLFCCWIWTARASCDSHKATTNARAYPRAPIIPSQGDIQRGARMWRSDSTIGGTGAPRQTRRITGVRETIAQLTQMAPAAPVRTLRGEMGSIGEVMTPSANSDPETWGSWRAWYAVLRSFLRRRSFFERVLGASRRIRSRLVNSAQPGHKGAVSAVVRLGLPRPAAERCAVYSGLRPNFASGHRRAALTRDSQRTNSARSAHG